MNIADINYVSQKVKNGREKGKELIIEHRNKLDKMVKDNTDENREIYREVRNRSDRHNCRILFYLDTEIMLKNGKTQHDIINYFKVNLNRKRWLLEQFKNLYSNEHPMMVGTPLANERLRVEELEKFMEEEIYTLL
ncbi:TPA: hypothetical protein N2D99_002066 [Clostridium botulinum]|nr:hypothetical protein [Clostridium botulinum]